MINLTVVIDNDEAIRKLRELQNVAKTTTSSVVKDSERVDAAWGNMKNTLAGMAAGVSFAALARQIVNIRGEVQQLEVAFETMLGSKQKADILMAEIIDLAAKTPFGLQDVSNATKMLLAYGSTAEEVADEIRMLGNIASGLSIPLNDLIYLYGTTRTQGQMFTQDLRQFMGRGIPLAEELAKQFGVTKNEVGGLVSAGRVGFEHMSQALRAMTSEGGQFNNLMEKQSQTISGQISNLEDAIYQMFNKIGQSSEGVISDVISSAAWMVEHYEDFLVILKQLIVAYGSYKAALIAVAAVQKAKAILDIASAYYSATKALRISTVALDLFNKTWKANPIGILAAGIGLVVNALSSFVSWTDDAAGATAKIEREIGELEQAEREEYSTVNRLVYSYEHLADSEEERVDILRQLRDISPDIVDGVDAQSDAIDRLKENLEAYNEVQLKTIQLALLTDTQRAAITEQAEATTDVAANNAELERRLADMAEKARSGELWEDIAFAYPDEERSGLERFNYRMRSPVNGLAEGFDRIYGAITADDIKREFERQILEVLNNATLDERGKVEAIRNLGVAGASGTYRLQGTGYGLVDLVEAIETGEQRIEDASAEIERLGTIMPSILSDLGLDSYGEDAEDGVATIRTYAEAFSEAQSNYLEAARALEAAHRDRSSVSEDEYESLRLAADDAKKKYQSLGGVVNDSNSTQQERQAQQRRDRIIAIETEAQRAIEQARIDAMEEGIEREMALADFNYHLREQQIVKSETELRRLQNGALTDSQNSMFESMRNQNMDQLLRDTEAAIFGDTDAQANAAIERMNAEREARNEYLREYGTFQERLLATTIYWNEQINAAKTEGERMALTAERDAILARFEVEASEWAQQLVGATVSQLGTMTVQLETELVAKRKELDAMASSTSPDAQALRDVINELTAKIEVLRDKTDEARSSGATDDWQKSILIFQGISEAASEAADGIAEYDENIANLFRSISQIAGAVNNFVGALKSMATAISSAEKASGILAIVSAAIQVISVLSSALKSIGNSQDELDGVIRQFRELNEEIERINRSSRIDSLKDTIFGSDAFGNFMNNLTVMRESLEAYDAAQKSIIERGKEITNAQVGYEGYGIAIAKGTWDSLEESLKNMSVLMKDRGKFAESWGFRDIYSTLGEQLPSLFGEDGVTLEGLQALRESDVWEKLSQENRDLIDDMIANWEAYNNAVESTNRYLSDIFGELGKTMTDALVDSFAAGTDAALDFGEAASEVVERLATDMIHAAFIQPIIAKYQAEIDSLNAEDISPEERVRRMTEMISRMTQEVLETQSAVNATAEQVKSDAESYGITGVFDGDSSQTEATSKGFQAMSQDTGDELNGRFTDIQGQAHRIAEAVEFCRGLIGQQVGHLQSINSTVAMIHNDTSLIEKHTRSLARIDENIESMRRSIDNGAL